MRRRRLIYDLPEKMWEKYRFRGEIFLVGYLIHYLPFYFVERTLFLHSYLPAYIYKILLLCCVIDHLNTILKRIKFLRFLYVFMLVLWILFFFIVFQIYLVVNYGVKKLTSEDVVFLRWKDTWDFILHREIKLEI